MCRKKLETEGRIGGDEIVAFTQNGWLSIFEITY